MRVIVDTSVWFQHFRSPEPRLLELLAADAVVMHSVILGEVAVGNLKNREVALGAFKAMPFIVEYSPRYCLDYLESRLLHGLGIGWCDVQILVSADHCAIPIWTFDKRLLGQAAGLGLAWTPPT